ncbi:MAG TPA: Fic family protein [Candidatus Saccharimonadales bacterium]
MNHSSQLKAILKASGWSQEELARRLNVSFVTINAWVNERAVPRKKAVESIRILYFEILGADSLDIGTLEELNGKIKYLKTTVREIIDNDEVLNSLILNLTYHTNTIEGSTMTLDDTKEVLFNNKILTNRTQAEQAEALNHRAALLWILDELEKKDFVISEDLVKGLNLRLMNGIMTNAGQYRNHSVRVMGAHVTVANFLRVPELMEELMNGLGKPSKDLITLISTTHATFEKIHPFSDGNGRVGRLLMLAQALQAGFVPPIVLKERKYAYYKYLELAQANDNSMPLQIFVADSMIAADELLFES